MLAKVEKFLHMLAYVGFFLYLCAVIDANNEKNEKTNHPCNRCDDVRGMQ